MKIDGSTKSVGNSAGSAAARTAGGSNVKSAASLPPQVDVSSVANHLQQLGEIGAADQVFDSKKVSEIRQAIAEGRFKVNPERIADGLLASVREMLSQGRQSA